MLIVDDEGAAGGQLDEDVSVCGKFGGPGPTSLDSGAVHFYEAAPDGTFANGGAVEFGSYNKPANANEGACVAHVFWQSPNQNRMTQAYYRKGMDIVDFEDPANAISLGSFVADGGRTTGRPSRTTATSTRPAWRPAWTSCATPAKAAPLAHDRRTGRIQRVARIGLPYKPLADSTPASRRWTGRHPDGRQAPDRPFALPRAHQEGGPRPQGQEAPR